MAEAKEYEQGELGMDLRCSQSLVDNILGSRYHLTMERARLKMRLKSVRVLTGIQTVPWLKSAKVLHDEWSSLVSVSFHPVKRGKRYYHNMTLYLRYHVNRINSESYSVVTSCNLYQEKVGDGDPHPHRYDDNNYGRSRICWSDPGQTTRYLNDGEYAKAMLLVVQGISTATHYQYGAWICEEPGCLKEISEAYGSHCDKHTRICPFCKAQSINRHSQWIGDVQACRNCHSRYRCAWCGMSDLTNVRLSIGATLCVNERCSRPCNRCLRPLRATRDSLRESRWGNNHYYCSDCRRELTELRYRKDRGILSRQEISYAKSRVDDRKLRYQDYYNAWQEARKGE